MEIILCHWVLHIYIAITPCVFSRMSEPKVRLFHTLLGVLLPQKSLVAPRSWRDNHITISSCRHPVSGLCSVWYPSQKAKSGVCFLLIPEPRRAMTEWNACWTVFFIWEEQTLMYKAKCHGSLACGSFEVCSSHHNFKDMRLKYCVSAVCIHPLTDRSDSPTYSKYGGNLQACHCLILQQCSFRLVNVFKPIYACI
jgi:hypothetical protein